MTPIFHFFYTFASLPNKNTAMSLKSIVILAMIGCLWHSSAAQNPVNMIFGKEKFTIKGDVNHDTIHIFPFYMPPLDKNCFTSDKRLMPVEFPSEMSQQVVVNITLPEGYTLAEIPQQVAASTPDKSISGIYFVSQTDNKVQIDFQFKINKVLHQVENYDKLRGIFDLFHKCSTQSIAIKKL